MATLSSAAWVLHDLGLASSVGGTLFGKAALHPAARNVQDRFERDQLVKTAWNRFSVMNLAGHLAMALPWFVGRRWLTGRETSRNARGLTLAKDVMVGTSLITGIATALLGRKLGHYVERGEGPATSASSGGYSATRPLRLNRIVELLGDANLVAMAGVIALTSVLAMQSSRSGKFAIASRFLP